MYLCFTLHSTEPAVEGGERVVTTATSERVGVKNVNDPQHLLHTGSWSRV